MRRPSVWVNFDNNTEDIVEDEIEKDALTSHPALCVSKTNWALVMLGFVAGILRGKLLTGAESLVTGRQSQKIAVA